MNSAKFLQWAGIVLGSSLALFFVYHYLQYFGDISFLGGILVLEVVIVSLWKYDQRFFLLLMITFVWAGIDVPLHGAWTVGRWVVLSVGAAVGSIVWLKAPRRAFGSLHLVAAFCIFTAFVSATVSPYVQMASLKALSLFLLFLYCASGARLAVLGREDRFFRGVLWGSEISVYVTAVSYLGLGIAIWDNTNALGAAMSIGSFPILLWGWLTSDVPVVKVRRLAALLLCTYLVYFSMARAGMAALIFVILVFCVCLHQYKLLVKVVASVLTLVAVTGMLAPGSLNESLRNLKDAVLYKGHKEEGVLASRRDPWEKSIATIKEHPLFGTGYGTSPAGGDAWAGSRTVDSNAQTAREHGSSYMTITEWVGLFGVLPFIALLAMTVSNVWKVCVRMNRTLDPRAYSIPVAMVVLAGLVHATFEDWLFAVGSYLCLFFWFFAFVLADFAPNDVVVPAAGAVSRTARQLPVALGGVAPNR
jgi:O-antigen ligase